MDTGVLPEAKESFRVEKEINNWFDEAGLLLKGKPDRLTEEQIHDARVAIKKIKATFHLIRYCLPATDTKDYTKVNRLFRKAGKIREWQLVQHIVKRLSPEGSGVLLPVLQKREKKAVADFKKEAGSFSPKSLKKLCRQMLQYLPLIDDSDIRSYFKAQLFLIGQKLEETTLPFREYHELRKELKETKYNLPWAGADIKDALRQIITVVELNRLEEMLGLWHDYVVAATLLLETRERSTRSTVIPDFADRALDRINAEAKKNLAETLDYIRIIRSRTGLPLSDQPMRVTLP